MKERRSTRSGATLVAALVCLLVVLSILSGMLHSAIRARRQLHVERDLRQTELLLTAGLDRAAAALRQSADYRGETWKVPAAEILGRGDGEVVIAVNEGDEANARQVHITAEYPQGSERSVRRSGDFTINVERTQNEE
jgi:type II secretory pathway component PulK